MLLSGVDARFRPVSNPAVRGKYKLPQRPFIFSVGTVQPRKNYARLIQALALLRQRGVDLALVISGGRGWLEDPIYAAIDEAKMREFVHFIGFADDADLPALYSAARVTAIPSLYEGFGLPCSNRWLAAPSDLQCVILTGSRGDAARPLIRRCRRAGQPT